MSVHFDRVAIPTAHVDQLKDRPSADGSATIRTWKVFLKPSSSAPAITPYAKGVLEIVNEVAANGAPVAPVKIEAMAKSAGGGAYYATPTARAAGYFQFEAVV